jgi:hypothetical protein
MLCRFQIDVSAINQVVLLCIVKKIWRKDATLLVRVAKLQQFFIAKQSKKSISNRGH